MKGPRLQLKHKTPQGLPLTMIKGDAPGLDLRDMPNRSHLVCPMCQCHDFNIIKFDEVVCVGCSKCKWEGNIYFPEAIDARMSRIIGKV